MFYNTKQSEKKDKTRLIFFRAGRNGKLSLIINQSLALRNFFVSNIGDQKLNFTNSTHRRSRLMKSVIYISTLKIDLVKFSCGFQAGIFLPTTVGSKSTKTARGTCFPAPVSLKNVLKESSPPPMVLSLGIWPSGWIPCSKQYNSQQAFPIWTPAWPTWTEIHSRCKKSGNILIKIRHYRQLWLLDLLLLPSKLPFSIG